MTEQEQILQRLTQLESRLARLEARASKPASPQAAPASGRGPARSPAGLPQPVKNARSKRSNIPNQVDPDLWAATPSASSTDSTGSNFTFDYTTLMGLAGIAAIILAGFYLISIALADGWLTPMRQVGLASIVGVVLIAAGFILPGFERYKSMLPAAGLSILYAAIYGGHAVHELLSWSFSAGAVGVLTVFGLWLGHLFRFPIYAYVSMVGCFLSPLLLQRSGAGGGDIATPAIFYLLWTMLFSGYALFAKSRSIYIVAGYFALLGFDYGWRMLPGSVPWQSVIGYQFVIFFLLAFTAVWYSLKHRSPLTYGEGMAHLPLISIFYGVQYYVLSKNTSLAPWISLASAGVVIGLYHLAKKRLRTDLYGGALIAAFYGTLVVVHAGFFELMPDRMLLWSSLLFLGGMGYALYRGGFYMATQWPIMAGFIIIFTLSCFSMLIRADTQNVPAVDLLHVIYAVIPYAIFALSDRWDLSRFAPIFLYIGHVNMMGAIVHFSPNRLMVTLLWTALAMATMAIGYQRLERHLARSALLIFAGSAAKLVLYDLNNSTPLVRVGCLVAVGLSLYAGGWIYKKIDARTS